MTRKAKTKRTIIEEELPPDPVLDADFAEIDASAMPSNIDSVIDGLESQVEKVTIYRRLAGQKQAYVVCLPIDEFADDGGVEGYVARYYGGGRYLARLQEANGKFIKGYTFSIDESVKPQAKTAKDGNGVTEGASTFERDLLLRLLEKPSGEGIAGQMQAIATIAAAQSQAMMTAMGPLLAKITELASGGGKGGSMADLVAAIQLGADMGGDKEDSYLPVIREVGVPLLKALEQYLATVRPRANSPKPTSIVRAVGAPPGQGPTEPAARVITEGPTAPPWAAMVAPYVGRVVDFAVHGGDPNIVAGIIYNNNPPLARLLEDAVEHDGFRADLLAQFSQLQPHATWVDALLDEFRDNDPEGGTDGTHEEIGEDGE